ncbi:MAG TPA: hypothetical protein VGF18_03755 [Candidatus Tumulicola sp.]
MTDSTAGPPQRARIADIIRDSGKMGDGNASSQGDIGAALGSLLGQPAGLMTVSQSLAESLSSRFNWKSGDAIETDLQAPYETAGRALILALQKCGLVVSSAFDTASGAILECKRAMQLFSNPITLTLALVDRDATTHLAANADHMGLDWGQNKKLLAQLFAKTNEYLALFRS